MKKLAGIVGTVLAVLLLIIAVLLGEIFGFFI